jgi:hypothetical protein
MALMSAMTLLPTPVKAQQAVVPEFGAGLNFNQTDVMMDVTAGVSFQQIRTSAKVSFQPRLGSKRVLIESSTPNLLFQYRERRYLLGLEADKRFQLTQFSENLELGLFIGGFVGMSFNDYRGTDERGSVSLGWQAMAGPYLSDVRGFILRLGYIYLPLPTQNVFAHRIGFSFSLLLTDDF